MTPALLEVLASGRSAANGRAATARWLLRAGCPRKHLAEENFDGRTPKDVAKLYAASELEAILAAAETPVLAIKPRVFTTPIQFADPVEKLRAGFELRYGGTIGPSGGVHIGLCLPAAICDSRSYRPGSAIHIATHREIG